MGRCGVANKSYSSELVTSCIPVCGITAIQIQAILIMDIMETGEQIVLSDVSLGNSANSNRYSTFHK